MTSDPHADALELLDSLKGYVGLAAAVASALADGRTETPAEALESDAARAAVLRTLPDPESTLRALWPARRARGNNLISVLSQSAAAASGSTQAWSDVSEEAMVAQGRSSALVAPVILDAVAPSYGVLTTDERATMLDVGTGVGAIAVALAKAAPSLEVTGIDVATRPLQIARAALAEGDAGVASRVDYRHQDVLELDDVHAFDIVWMPLPFFPAGIVDAALARVARAVRPGGLVVLGTLRGAQHPRLEAVDSWLSSLSGGGTHAPEDAADRLAGRGFTEVQQFETVPGGPVLVAGVAPR